MNDPSPSDSASLLRAYRRRVTIFLCAVCLLLPTAAALWVGLNTLHRLQVVERQRDGWQRPADALQRLKLKEGDVVADLGSGAGYFALKMSDEVGRHGRVMAVDIRRLSLFFLWIRTWSQRRDNVEVTHGGVEAVTFPRGSLNATLVANAYHEFFDREAVLGKVFKGLVPGGRLVVLEPGPPVTGRPREVREHEHGRLSPEVVERDLRRCGFDVLERQDAFITMQGQPPWWLIVARKPE